MGQIERPGLLGQVITRLGLARKTPRDRHAVHINSEFLSDVETSFFRALRQAAGTWAAICPKVALTDLLSADDPDAASRMDGRRVDFVLFDLETMRPLMAIELDTRPVNDPVLDELLADAGLPFHRVPVQRSYPVRELSAALRQAAGIDDRAEHVGPRANGRAGAVPHDDPSAPPSCPLCGRIMALRTVGRPGPYEGKQFWACADYPGCRGVREYHKAK